MSRVLALLAAILLCLPAAAKDAAPMAQDEATEQRMIAISQDLRCLVCQNESLAGSRAALAEDLRREIRELIRAGKTDDEITTYLVDRYGDFVRYRPPLKAGTLVLWFGPFVLLAGALAALLWFLRGRNRILNKSDAGEAPLTAEEQQRTDGMLRANDNSSGGSAQ
jgi:cytochrome c-type biogenesis protein CcmH